MEEEKIINKEKKIILFIKQFFGMNKLKEKLHFLLIKNEEK